MNTAYNNNNQRDRHRHWLYANDTQGTVGGLADGPERGGTYAERERERA